MPNRRENEMLGIVSQRVGGTQIMILCEDGKERNCRIPGKMKKKVWMRADDVVIVKIWDFQPSKGDVVWRYTDSQAEYLRKRGFVQRIIDAASGKTTVQPPAQQQQAMQSMPEKSEMNPQTKTDSSQM